MTKAPTVRKRSAAIETAPEAAPEVVEGKIVTEPYIVFREITMLVRAPDEGQFAILVEAERYLNTLQKKRASIGLRDDTPADDPRWAKAEQLINISKNHLARIMSVIGSLFLDEADWDFIRDGVASREISRVELFELPTRIIAATREADEMKPDNRAAKRRAQRAR